MTKFINSNCSDKQIDDSPVVNTVVKEDNDMFVVDVESGDGINFA